MGRGAAIILVGVIALVAGLYWLAYRPHTYRYRMTVEVETPQGLKTGSAVREVKWFPQPRIMTGNTFTFKQRGEAVAVDLPNGQTLFALLDVNGYETVLAGFGPAPTSELRPLLDRANADRKLYIYPPRNALRPLYLDLPRFVRFRDTNDPKSVELVDPSSFETSFGPGYRIGRITVQITDEPVSFSILERLSWLGPYPEPRLDRQYKGSSNPTIAEQLAHGDFQRGLER